MRFIVTTSVACIKFIAYTSYLYNQILKTNNINITRVNIIKMVNKVDQSYLDLKGFI